MKVRSQRPGAVPAWEGYCGCIHDLTERHRTEIEQRAYALYAQGVHGHADADRRQTQAEVLRDGGSFDSRIQKLPQLPGIVLGVVGEVWGASKKARKR
jgi:hypothetical protein